MKNKILFLLAFVTLVCGQNITAQTRRASVQEVLVSTARNTVPVNGFISGAPNYEIVNLPQDGRTNVIKINGKDCDWKVISYSLAAYSNKNIKIKFSADVMRVGAEGNLWWGPSDVAGLTMAYQDKAETGIWYRMSGELIITPLNNQTILHLSTHENNSQNSVFYFDNLNVTIDTWEYTPASVLAAAGEASSNNTRNIYVSASKGSDSGNGTQARPFAKIAHAMYYVKPGDTVFVDSGTYNEKFRIPTGASGKPVTLTAMPNAAVIITPTIQIIPQWKQYKGNIYVADISEYVKNIDTEFPQLFAGGDSMVEARWPNMGPSMSTIHSYERDIAGRGTNKNTVVASKNIPSDITGARVVIYTGENNGAGWFTSFSHVQSVNGRTIKLTNELTGDGDDGVGVEWYTPNPGNVYYITGALALLDAPGEYYFDPKTNFLYFYPPWNGTPDQRTLTMRQSNSVAIMADNTSYVNIKNIAIYGGGINMQNVKNNTLENCRINYAAHFYINGLVDLSLSVRSNMTVTGSNNRITKCEFGHTAGSGIILGGDDNIFTNNIVHHTNYSGSIIFAGLYLMQSKRTEISHNTILNSARSHICFESSVPFERNIIRNNYFENAATLNSDAGSIYIYDSDAGGTEIYNNFSIYTDKSNNGTMADIRDHFYIDHYTSNYSIHHNIAVGGNTGIMIGLSSRNERYYNNTVINADYGIGFFGKPVDNAEASTSSATDNLFIGIKKYVISYAGTENGKNVNYSGNFRNGTIPVPERQAARIQSSGNAIGTVDAQYRPTGRTPDIGAIPRNGELFPYGADWKIGDRR